jgi:hypothetical protein
MIRIDRRFRAPLISQILEHFDQNPFKDFLLVRLDKHLEHYSTRNGFEAQVVDTITDAEQKGWLVNLLEKLKQERHGMPLADLIDEIYAAYNEGLTWYACNNPANTRFVGRMPFVDRRRFRNSLADLEGHSLNMVLCIQGELGAGKSYLWNYIYYLYRTHSPGTCALIDMDDYPEVHSIDDKGLMTLILSGLGLGSLTSYDESAQSFLRASSLIGQLTHQVNERPEQDRYIVIDSLDNQCLAESGFTLLEMLALQVGRGNIPRLRLILMGYDKDPPGHNKNNVHILKEDIHAIAHADVQQFFQDVAADIDVELDSSIAEAAAQRAIDLTEEQEANQLHDQIAKIASDIFDPEVAGGG